MKLEVSLKNSQFTFETIHRDLQRPATRSQVKTILNRGTYLDLYGLFESVFSVGRSPPFLGRLFLEIIAAKNDFFSIPKYEEV